MTLSERSRSSLYNGLTDVVGDEEAVSEMLSYFPARDVEEPLTKEFFRAEMAIAQAETQAEFAALRSELRAEMQAGLEGLRAEMREGDASLRAEMQAGLEGLRAEMREGDASLRAEIQALDVTVRSELVELRAEMHAGFQRQMVWSVSTMLAFATLLIGAFAVLS